MDKEWEKRYKLPAWPMTNAKSKKKVIKEAEKEGRTVHFASLMDICHLKNAELEEKHQKYKGRVVLRGDIVKDDSGSYAVFTEQGSSASRMTAAKVVDVIARRPGCAGQAADAVSACTQVKQEDAPALPKTPKSACPDRWIRVPRHNWPKSWSNSKTQLFLLDEICLVSHLRNLKKKRFYWDKVLKKVPNWECIFVHRKQGLFLSVYVHDLKKKARKRHNLNPIWKKLMKLVDPGEPKSFLDHVYLGCTQRECKSNGTLSMKTRKNVRIVNLCRSN